LSGKAHVRRKTVAGLGSVSTLSRVLHPKLAWYVAGPVMGLCVVAVRALFNARLGVTGGFSEVVGRVAGGARVRLAGLVPRGRDSRWDGLRAGRRRAGLPWVRMAHGHLPRVGTDPDRADPAGRGRADRVRRQAGRGLHVR